MATTSEIMQLVGLVVPWLHAHGSDLLIAVVASVVGAIISAMFDFRKKAEGIAIRLTQVHTDSSHHNQTATDEAVVAPQDLEEGATGLVAAGNAGTTVQIAGDNYAPIALPGVPVRDEAALPYEQNALVDRVIEVTAINGVPTTFADHYRRGYAHLEEGHAALAANEYHCGFRQIREVFLARSTYEADLNEALLQSLETGFRELAAFSDGSETNIARLRATISGLENTINSVFAYVTPL